jgi:hypothetical protein
MDARDREAMAGRWYKSLDEKKMVVEVEVPKEDDDDEVIEVPIEFAACGLCRGRGKHVNPSIDSNGISAEEFAEDPDFAESYMEGHYDVQCYRCGGKRVEPVILWDRLEKGLAERVQEHLAGREDDIREREAEARFQY